MQQEENVDNFASVDNPKQFTPTRFLVALGDECA